MAIERLGRRNSLSAATLMASTASATPPPGDCCAERVAPPLRHIRAAAAARATVKERNAPIGIERTPAENFTVASPAADLAVADNRSASRRPPRAPCECRNPSHKSSYSVARSCQPPSPGRPVIRFMSSLSRDAWMNSSDTPGRRSRIVRSQYALRSSSGRCWSTGHRKSGTTMPALANSSRKPAAPLVATSSCEAILIGRANSWASFL